MNRIKPVILLLLQCFLPGMILSQQIPTGYEAEANLNELSRGSSTYIRTFNTGYEGVKGTPLLLEEFRKGNIYLNNKTKAPNQLLNFNCYTGELLYSSQGKEFILNSTNVDFFIIESNNGNYSVFKQVFIEAEKSRVFLQILHKDKSTLYLHRMKEFIPADYTGPYNANRRYDEYKDKHKFYIQFNDATIQQVIPRKKSILKLFEDRADQINTYLKKENPDFKNQDDLIKLVKFYDNLE